MSPLKGIALKVASVCIFVAMASLIKATRVDVPPGETVFFRSLFALPVIAVWLMIRREIPDGVRVNNPWAHLWRGLIGGSAMGLGFAGLGFLPLPEVTAIGYAAPLLVVVFAAFFLGERVRFVRFAAVGMGMVGVMLVLGPKFSVSASPTEVLGATVVLFSAVCAALAQVTVRKLVTTESTTSIVFWFTITCTLLSLLTIPWGWVWPTPTQAAMLIGAGLLGGVGQILLTSSYKYADASIIAPFDYTSMLLAIGIGFVVFDETPSLMTLLGATIIIAAGVLIIWRERQLGLERAAQRTVSGVKTPLR